MPAALSIIIVNYKTPQLCINCIRSIYQFPTDLEYEIIIVDNASGDRSREEVLSVFPSVKWIQMDYNAGFARANNEGMRQSSADTYLLLNSDTIILDDAIASTYRQLIPSVYLACGVQLLNEDGSPQISGNYFMKGGLNNLLPLPYIGSFLKWLGNLFSVKKPNIPNASSTVEVDWINGAFLMVKKQALAKAGMMDEDFFLYAEEAEWCSRIGKFGKLALFGQYKVLHLQGATANETFGSSSSGYQQLYDRKGLQVMVSNFVRIRKQFGKGWFLFHLLAYTLAIPVIAICTFFENLFRLRWPFKGFGQLGGFSGNTLHVWDYAWNILKNAPFFYKVL